jgi:hypothetical protein
MNQKGPSTLVSLEIARTYVQLIPANARIDMNLTPHMHSHRQTNIISPSFSITHAQGLARLHSSQRREAHKLPTTNFFELLSDYLLSVLPMLQLGDKLVVFPFLLAPWMIKESSEHTQR